MLNKKLQIDISKAMSICLRNGVKVYPVISDNKFKVEVNNKGNIVRYNKEVVTKELNKALSTTYKYFAVQILKQQTDANSTIKA